MKISINKKAVFAFLAIYSLCEPWYLKQFFVLHIIALVFRAVMLVYCLFYEVFNKEKKNRYIFVLMIAIPICYMIGNIVAGDSLFAAGKTLINLFAQSIFLLHIFTFGKNETGMYLSGMSIYMQLICVINTISSFFLLPNITIENYFFLGGDNGSIKIYLEALMITYVERAYFVKRKTNQFIVLFISLTVFAIHRQIGTGCVVVAIVLAGYFINQKQKGMQVSLTLLTGLSVITWIALLATAISFLEDIINKLLFGKYESLSSRVTLWLFYLANLRKSIWFGKGVSTVGDLSFVAENRSKWIVQHNTHNTFLEVLYNGGVMAFLFFMVLLICVAIHFDRHKRTEKATMIALIIFAYQISGLVECGFSQIIFLLPFAFYIEVLEEDTE